jgi:xanthine dehydrogenase YagR molybdenum-binding subunit
VNDATGMVKIPRFVAVTGAGRILNPKTSRSQIIGGVIWGIGMALTEESLLDPRWGNFVTRTFADYHIRRISTSAKLKRFSLMRKTKL